MERGKHKNGTIGEEWSGDLFMLSKYIELELELELEGRRTETRRNEMGLELALDWGLLSTL